MNYDFKEIKKVAAKYFRGHFNNEFETDSESMKEIYKDLWGQTENDIEISDILGNIFVVKYKVPEKLEHGIFKDNSIWIYNNNSWKMILFSAFAILLLYLNSDMHPDVISMSGFCVMNDINV